MKTQLDCLPNCSEVHLLYLIFSRLLLHFITNRLLYRLRIIGCNANGCFRISFVHLSYTLQWIALHFLPICVTPWDARLISIFGGWWAGNKFREEYCVEEGIKVTYYWIFSMTVALNANFGASMDSGDLCSRPPRVQISADKPCENIWFWSVIQMKSEGGICWMRSHIFFILGKVFVKNRSRKPLSSALNIFLYRS